MSIRLGTDLLAGMPDTSVLANTNLSNLTSTGKNITNWSLNVTNCITEIPQDIKLEIESGVLTLKAGSKLYVPNGVGIFDEVTTSSDLTIQSGSGWLQDNYFIFYDVDTSGLHQAAITNSSSGTTEPSPKADAAWFDTTNNIIKRYNGSGTSYDKVSLPICICTNPTGSLFESITQVLNGFSCIGSTVFALPGVKGLVPNGRNSDGTLRSTPFTIDSVTQQTYTDTPTGEYYIQVKNNYVGRAARSGWSYDEKHNFVWWSDSTSPMTLAIVGSMYMTSGKFTDLIVPQAFHALDWNAATEMMDGHWVSSQITVAQNVSISASGELEYSLSSYLPKDGYNYEVLFSLAVATGSTSGDGLEVGVCSDRIYSTIRAITAITRTNSTNNGACAYTIPVGTGRKLIIRSFSSYAGTIRFFRTHAYRRIGKNQ